MSAARSQLKIIAATSMTIFTLLACFTGAYAWFNAARTRNVENESFEVTRFDSAVTSISVHNFLGTTSDGNTFGFNPTPSATMSWTGKVGSQTGNFTMSKFSLTDPHHPVLFLFAVNGGIESIRLKTNCTYLAGDKPTSITDTVASYAALEARTNTVGDIVEVSADESHNGANTVYEIVTGENPFNMLWIALAEDNNPLSSVIQSHSVLFVDNPTDNEGSNQKATGSLTLSGETQTQTYIPVTSNLSDNEASFVTFTNGVPSFHKTASLFNDSTAGHTHIGIVLDYYSSSLEYISSFFLGHSYLNEGLGFSCDWTMEV